MPRRGAIVTTILRGREHPVHGAIAVESPRLWAAVATSAGARPSPRPPLDPNEDCAALALGERVGLLVVADAHNGCDASEFATSSVLEALGDDPPERLTRSETVSIVWDAGMAVQKGISRAGSLHRSSRTTVAFALVTAEYVQWASFGDSCVLITGGGVATRVDTPRPSYLGYMFTTAEIGALLSSRCVPRERHGNVILATDALVDFGVPQGRTLGDAVAEGIDGIADAASIARRLVEQTLRCYARDAMTVAVASGRIL